MGRDRKTTLTEARNRGKIEQFIAEHETDPPGDMDKLVVTIKRSSAETAKSDPEASKRDRDDD